LHPVFFLFVAAPMACAKIIGEFGVGAKLAYFIAMFLYASLAVRINFFRGISIAITHKKIRPIMELELEHEYASLYICWGPGLTTSRPVLLFASRYIPLLAIRRSSIRLVPSFLFLPPREIG
jgi:hypothetical protein